MAGPVERARCCCILAHSIIHVPSGIIGLRTDSVQKCNKSALGMRHLASSTNDDTAALEKLGFLGKSRGKRISSSLLFYSVIDGSINDVLVFLFCSTHGGGLESVL
ncbi:hypothetical protein CIHG_06651 [Coccidioides immitis H538.4]|uniref:Uncharacterized protein n=1 Tax=Coccidioides immitis H538.4 TaxID=396776 RepID=A0A0J8RXG0_COCIT|nr:hypothetical protein CIHG_06651 [Coccidioides immitis H538.4]